MSTLALLASVNIGEATAADASAEVSADARLLAQQNTDLATLVRRAAEESYKGTPAFNPAVYYAIIRQGLALLSGEAATSGRGMTGPIGAFDELNSFSVKTIPGVDDDPEGQAQIETLLGLASNGTRVVGGAPVAIGQFEAVVAIEDPLDQLGCTGTVVAKGWVLTAAHCVCGMRLDRGNTGILIRFGNANLSNVSTHSAPPMLSGGKVRYFTWDPGFCTTFARIIGNSPGFVCSPDLAMIAYEPARTPPTLKPFGIADTDTLISWQRTVGSVIVAGYGATRDPGPDRPGGVGPQTVGADYGNKNTALVPIHAVLGTNEVKCDINVPRYGIVAGRDMVLLDSTKVADTCRGDSGGPAIIGDANDGSRKVVAVTSRGRDPAGKCGAGGIYSRVDLPDTSDWIKAVIESTP